MKENKAIVQEIWITSILYPKTSTESYHHYNEQKVFHKKVRNIHRKTPVLEFFFFFNKNTGFQGPSFIKKKLEQRCFLRTPILKNICKRLFLRFSLELFSICTNNIGSEEDVFSKIKLNINRSKTQLYEKNLSFHDVFITAFFAFSSLQSDGICPT